MQRNNKNFEVIKIVLGGDSFAGKTIFREVLTENIKGPEENPCYMPTIGVDFSSKTYPDSADPTRGIKFQVWDTAVQERFRTLTNAYLGSVELLILFIDLTRSEQHYVGWRRRKR